MHEGEDIGGWDMELKREEYDALYSKQQATIIDFEDIITSKEDVIYETQSDMSGVREITDTFSNNSVKQSFEVEDVYSFLWG